jgi:hypothetical protein
MKKLIALFSAFSSARKTAKEVNAIVAQTTGAIG